MGKRKSWNLIIGSTLIVGATAILLNSQPARASNQHEPSLINSIRGDNLYRAYCASCHGIDAKGNGPMAAWLKVQPSDLTRIAARYGGKFPLERVDRIISGEESLQSGHGTRAMPVWGPIFSQVSRDQDLGRVRIDNLARYLRNLQVE
jgi:mono/diheme cytochrome c family protein